MDFISGCERERAHTFGLRALYASISMRRIMPYCRRIDGEYNGHADKLIVIRSNQIQSKRARAFASSELWRSVLNWMVGLDGIAPNLDCGIDGMAVCVSRRDEYNQQ